MKNIKRWVRGALAGPVFGLLALAAVPGANAAVVYNNGSPNQANANNLGIVLQADDFVLSGTTTITDVHFWSLEAAGDYRGGIFWALALNAGGSPGAFVASGLQTVVARAATGINALGFAEFQIDFNLNAPVNLAAGTYWLVLHNGARTNLGDPNDFYWETTANNATVRGRESDDNAVSWTSNGNEHAFFLTGNAAGVVPEPATALILATGLVGLLGMRRKNLRKNGKQTTSREI